MKLVYIRGRKTNFNFMPFAKVVHPDTAKDISIDQVRFYDDEHLRFTKHDVSFKSAMRIIRKQNYPKGTVVHLMNWYVGLADILVII